MRICARHVPRKCRWPGIHKRMNRIMDSLIQIKETAASWLARRTGRLWTPSDEAEFNTWIGASIRHRVEYLSLENRWRDADRLKVVASGLKTGRGGDVVRWDTSPYFGHL